MRKFIKSNIKVLIVFILGGVILGSVGVYAATVLSGSDVSYSNTSSGLTATTVQGAIDEIYNNMVPIDSSTFKTNTAKTVYASSKGVCIKRSNKLNCFKINNWVIEKEHIQQLFSDVSCIVESSRVICNGSDFRCDVYSSGRVGCGDYSDGSACVVNSDSSVACS